MKQKNNLVNVALQIMILIIVSIGFMFGGRATQIAKMSIEERKALSYGELENEDYSTQSENVEFSAFFARDLDNDGYAERIKGVTSSLENENEELYFELKVSSSGHLDNGRIVLETKNIDWKTTLIEDNVVSGNYIGKTNYINLQEQVNAGSEKLFSGTISPKITNNINDYSQINSVTLVGDYFDEQGNKININIKRNLQVDWYGNVSTRINSTAQEEDVTYTNDYMKVNFEINTSEQKEKLILKDNIVTAKAPILNGYKAIGATVSGLNKSQYEFDEETGVLTITKSSQINDAGKVIVGLNRVNNYKVTFTYPAQAKGVNEEGNAVRYTQIEIPVTSSYSAYNNQSEDFENIVESKVASIIAFVEPKGGNGTVLSAANVTIGEKAEGRYIVSKEKAIQAYNKIETEEDNYNVVWTIIRGVETNNISLKETKPDTALASDTNYDLSDVVSNIGIYFECSRTVNNVKIYNDETNELIEEFTNISNISKENPYMYKNAVKKVRVEIGTLGKNAYFKIYHIKQIDDKALTQKITKEQFDKISGIYSYLETCFLDYENANTSELAGYADFNEEESKAIIEISKKEVNSNELNETQEIKITTTADEFNQIGWLNGSFLVELPKDIVYANIEEIEANLPEIEIIGYNIYKENDKYFIKVLTKNETRKTYSINIKCNIVINPLAPATNESFKLYAYNENCNTYYPKTQDIYDVNDNGNTEENVGTYICNMSILAPSTLITGQTVTNYDEENSVTVAPNIAIVKKQTRTADININVFNNYEKTISEIKILGEIPYEGNTYIENENELGSQFTAVMQNSGIKIPNSLEGKVKVYYSENEAATKDLTDENNGWKETPSDFSKVRRFLIDFGNNLISAGNKHVFTYTVEIPEGIDYNKFSYSEYAIYFAYVTENGKITTQVEPNKAGIRIARKYGIDITKINSKNNKLVPGAVYKLTELDNAGNEISSRLLTTNAQGKLIAKNLFVESKYTLKEVKSPNNYMLNKKEIKFVVTENENGELEIQELSQDKFDVNPVINNDIVVATVKDDPRYQVILTKIDRDTQEKLSNVQFFLTPKSQSYITDSEGKAYLTDLEPDVEYTLKEIYSDGYYLLDEIKFKLLKNGNEYTIVSENTEFSNAQVTIGENDDLITIEVELGNDKQPSIVINKVDSETKEPIDGVYLSVKEKNGKTYKTQEDGKVEIKGFKENEEYTIEEIKADGYYLKEIKFKIVRDENNKLKIESSDADFANAVVIDELRKILSIELNNEKMPTYKLRVIKQEEASSKLLENAKFQLMSEDFNTVKEYTTNSEGIIEIPNLCAYLAGKELTGKYTLQEIEAPYGYSNNAEKIKFTVRKNVANDLEVEIENRANLKTLKNAEISNEMLTLTIEDKPLFTLYKRDKNTGAPLANVGFSIMELTVPMSYAKDINGNFVGTRNEQGQYIVRTDAEGKISLPLKNGKYVIIEMEYPEGYKQEELMEYFEVKTGITETESYQVPTIDNGEILEVTEIEYIEDLLKVAKQSEQNNFANKEIILKNTLDFEDEQSYRNANDTSFGDINEDGVEETIKEELTKGKGFPGLSNYDYKFAGTFNGNNKTIKNLTSKNSFIKCAQGTIIKDLTVTGNINIC